jgi:hypothetical protein
MIPGATDSASDRPPPPHEGGSVMHWPDGTAAGECVDVHGERHYRIARVDAMPPFLLSVVSRSNLWLYASSWGPFTAGRASPEGSIFPYQTADRILRHQDSGGCLTVLRVTRDGRTMLWQPWRRMESAYALTRNLYKNLAGTAAVYEEINHDLALVFRHRLTAGEPFGLLRFCALENLADAETRIDVLDGWHQIRPPGIDTPTMAGFSYLAKAYMRHDLDPASGMGVFTMNARLSDKAEPAESLTAACAWSAGLETRAILLSDRRVADFCRGRALASEAEQRGDLGAYLVHARVPLAPRAAASWCFAIDTGLDHAALADRRRMILEGRAATGHLEQAASENTRGVRALIAAADGFQRTGDEIASAHHYSNVLFNTMRGGVFHEGYTVRSADFRRYVETHGKRIAARNRAFLDQLPDRLALTGLLFAVDAVGDAQFARIAHSYLPLTFSRRHGDPSRPWNHFSIRVHDEAGRPVFYYQGNWRDIFQNWEALGCSFPLYLEAMIAVFLNASTADGYNPYRVTRDGIDWEIEDPHDPWANIGYWGDHQIVYLLKLLERLEAFLPGTLAARLHVRRYAYARVPYEILPFETLVNDPRASVRFQQALHGDILRDLDAEGADARLWRDGTGNVLLVALVEKLMLPALVKLTNFVPGGGVWMNTQRPEWNDANNALAGWGVSVVTTCALRRYFVFLRELLDGVEADAVFEWTGPAATLLRDLTSVLEELPLDVPLNPRERYQLMERLGTAGARHRARVYKGEFAPLVSVPLPDITALIKRAVPVLEATLRESVRADGLYDSYNVLSISPDQEAIVHRLDPMLEGQVAVIESGFLGADEIAALYARLRGSGLWREDQKSFLLYPDRALPPFLERNRLPPAAASRAPLVDDLLRAGDRTIVVRDSEGGLHFAGGLTNARDLERALDRLARDEAWNARVSRDRRFLLDLWEEVFNHRSFTGRSTTMFGFEGLGCIYWHMISKLLLGVSRNVMDGAASGRGTNKALLEVYRDIREGLGYKKSPAVFGAFPLDPYSHSPAQAGAQQPGMTGQVKEDILARFGELGLAVRKGELRVEPAMLEDHEFSREPFSFSFINREGAEETWDLPAGSLAATCCQVPVAVRKSGNGSSVESLFEGKWVRLEGTSLGGELSRKLFARDPALTRVVFHLAGAG